MTRLPILILLLAFTTVQVTAEELVPEKPGETPPPVMGSGSGKGKGKGKGRLMPPSPTTPAPAPAPAAPPNTSSGLTPAGASGDQTANADFFNQKILPVLQQKCFECHQTGRKMKGGLALDSHMAMVTGGDSGPSLVPGDPGNSLLYLSITHADPDLQMPPRERLSASALADFKKWIEMGAPFGANANQAVGKAAPAAATESAGFFATLTAVLGNSVTYTRDEGDGGMMRGGMGKGKGKGGAMRGGDETTQELADKVIITSATLARRTQDLLVGIELSGGLSNPAFDAVQQGGARAHLVVKDGQITELNLITSQEENDAPIAVKPKRPPAKSATLIP